MSWEKLQNAETDAIRPQLVLMGNSILWSTESYRGERGMVEFDTKSNKIQSITPYPKNIEPYGHCICKLRNIIYIVDGWNQQQITSFNPQTKEFKVETKMEKIGHGARCIAVNDGIHILGGEHNENKHCIYETKGKIMKTLSTTDWIESAELVIIRYCRSIQIIPHEIVELLLQFYYIPNIASKISEFAIAKYKNQVIKFGGYDWDNRETVDDFFISSRIKEKSKLNIRWRKMAFAKCCKPIYRCGYITYKEWIISFGGRTTGNEEMDAIYLLNINDTAGWIEVKHIRCPAASCYVAALDTADNVHLLDTGHNGEHFTISLWKILNNITSKHA